MFRCIHINIVEMLWSYALIVKLLGQSRWHRDCIFLKHYGIYCLLSLYLLPYLPFIVVHVYINSLIFAKKTPLVICILLNFFKNRSCFSESKKSTSNPTEKIMYFKYPCLTKNIMFKHFQINLILASFISLHSHFVSC